MYPIFRLTDPKSLPPSRQLPEDASKADSTSSRSPRARRARSLTRVSGMSCLCWRTTPGYAISARVFTPVLEDAAYAVVAGTSSPTGDAWQRQIREAMEVSQSMTRVDVNCSRMSPIEGIEGSVSS